MMSKGAVSMREKPKKAHIIDCALRKIAECGSFSVTMEDIARSAGLSKGGLAHYFSSKDELFEAAFNEFFDAIYSRGKETIERYDNPLDKLLSYRWLLNWEDSDVVAGYPLLFDCNAMAARDPRYSRLFNDWIERWVDLLKGSLKEGIESGDFPDLEPDATARMISAIYHGVAIRWYLDQEKHSSQWAIHSLRKAIMGLLHAGIEREPQKKVGQGGAVFETKEKLYEVMGALFNTLLEDPTAGPKFREAKMIIKYSINNPQATMWVSPDRGVINGEADLRESVELLLSGDTLHHFLMKKISMPVALSQGLITARGPIPLVLKIVQLLKPVYTAYPKITKQFGL